MHRSLTDTSVTGTFDIQTVAKPAALSPLISTPSSSSAPASSRCFFDNAV